MTDKEKALAEVAEKAIDSLRACAKYDLRPLLVDADRLDSELNRAKRMRSR